MIYKTPKKVKADNWKKPEPSYASKPFSIGAVIKRISEEKHITPIELEKRMGLIHQNIYRLFKAKTLSMKQFFAVSEALEENLLLLFHPNVKPLPNPLQAELDQLKAENEILKAQLNEAKRILLDNTVLKGQLDVLKEVMKGK